MFLIRLLINALIIMPQKIASYFEWAGPLLARITVGYVFMLTGWGKLHNLDGIIGYFMSLGIPFAEFTTPFVAYVECVCGALLILGLLTRIAGGALAVTMLVAIVSAKWADIDSLETLLGFEEATYFAVFTWLAICGAGKASLDHFLVHKFKL